MNDVRLCLVPFVLIAACAPPPCHCGQTAEESAGSEEHESARTELNLEAATLDDTARLLSRILERPVVVGPDAVVLADCVFITAIGGGPLTQEEVVRIVRSSLEGSGIELAQTRDGIVFRRAPGGELPRCTRPTEEASTMAPPPEPPAPQPEYDALMAQVHAGIDETHHTLSRRALDLVFSDQTVLMRAARVIPQEENGRVTSIRLYGIRRNSLLGWLGFQNGDGVTRVNGHDVTSPDGALEVYARLANVDQLNIELIRRGSPMTISWRIVP
jgi:hypothetical protein